jgi:EmrB/QacA subfamily drug resistance transporter
MAASPDHAHKNHPDAVHDRRWLVLAVLALCQLMVVLDSTIVNIALPSAQADLGFGDADRQWVVTAYALAFGGLLLLGGRLSDLFGRRNTLVVGLIGFALASALGGFATNFETLVAARALQGVFGAVLAPSTLSIMTTTFTNPAERGKAFGIFGAIAGAGAAIGLLLGGVLTEYLSWHWCLLVNVPIAVVAVVGALVLVHAPRGEDRPVLDWPGTVVVVLSLVALVYGFSYAETNSWTSPVTLGLVIGGALGLVLFVMIERRVAHPLLPMRVVLDRFRGGAYLALGLTSVGIFAVFLFLTYHFQQVLGYSPLRSGFAFLPMVVGIATSSTLIVTRLLPRTGPKPLTLTGQGLAALGLVLLAFLDTGSGYLTGALPALLVTGLGLGLIFGSSFNTATSGALPHDAGVASAMVNTGQQVGGALGTALLNTIAAGVTSDRLASFGSQPDPAQVAEAVVAGGSYAFFAAAGILVLAAAVVALVMPKGTPAPASEPVLGH